MSGDNLAALSDGAGGVALTVLPRPALASDDDVLVRMLLAPVNPADLLVLDGRYSVTLDPAAPLGAEGIGVVEAVGAGVTGLRPGDRVVPLTRGNWVRYWLLRQEQLVAVPPGIPDEQGAMARINPPTAALLLDGCGAEAGDVIVQNAAGSAVAHWVRLLAARRGIGVVDVVRHADAALPDAIIDGPDLAARVKAAAAGRPVRAALDCIAGQATERMVQCLSPGGRVMLFGHMSGDPVMVRSQLLTGGGLSISGFSLRPAEAALGGEGVRRLIADLLDRPAAPWPVRARVPLAGAQDAVTVARAGGRGRVLLDLSA